MGITNTTLIGAQFNNWTVNVSQGKTQEDFTVSDTSKGNADNYIQDFVALTKSYIQEYDTDGSGDLSFEELYKKECEIAKGNGAKEPDEATCKNVFDRLNVDTESNKNTKTNLSEMEIFNYFYAMDSVKKLDGKISSDEYIAMALSLGTKDEGVGSTLKNYLQTTFNNLFKN